MTNNNIKFNTCSEIGAKINSIRQNALNKKKRHEIEKLDYPINFWIKEDRLLDKIGKEFTIILRSSGCNWTQRDEGGCSMCGYYLDAYPGEVTAYQLINQFDYAYNKKIDEINRDNKNYILKIFNSGSFLDEKEIPKETRNYILGKVSKVSKIKEIILETRLEFITQEKLLEIKDFLNKKYIEIAIGLETVDDYIRNNYINKGAQFEDFKKTLKICKELGIGVKAYLLFKPVFLNEQAAIDDCANSIKTLIEIGINSISINPMNIQKGTLVEYLWHQNRYRAPWFYSLFKCVKISVRQEDLKHTRILSDPTGAGTKRGIHNCLNKECKSNSKRLLRNFVLSQNLDELENKKYECNCKRKYQFVKNYY